MKLYANNMNVLTNDNGLLKYIQIWNKNNSLFNKKFNKNGFYSEHTYRNERIKTTISSCNEKSCDFKKLTKK